LDPMKPARVVPEKLPSGCSFRSRIGTLARLNQTTPDKWPCLLVSLTAQSPQRVRGWLSPRPSKPRQRAAAPQPWVPRQSRTNPGMWHLLRASSHGWPWGSGERFETIKNAALTPAGEAVKPGAQPSEVGLVLARQAALDRADDERRDPTFSDLGHQSPASIEPPERSGELVAGIIGAGRPSPGRRLSASAPP